VNGRGTKTAKDRRAYWAMVMPSFLIYLFVFGFPIILANVLSLSNYGGGKMFGGAPWRITGFQQYLRLFTDPYFWNALKNNIYIVLISVFGQLPLGFIFAYLIYRKTVKFGEFWQGVLYVPAMISTIVVGILWSIIFSPYGPIADTANHYYADAYSAKISEIFQATGGLSDPDALTERIIKASPSTINTVFSDPSVDLKDFLLSYETGDMVTLQKDLVNLLAPRWNADFLSKNNVAMIPICFVTLWMWVGTYLLIFLANMQKIERSIIEAAQIDGASEMQIMERIVLPSLSKVIANSAILCISGSLSGFALILAMTGGGPARVTQVLSIYMYDKAFMGASDYPLANAIAIMIVLFSLLLVALMFAFERRFGGKE
jgi:ABC-type sugar transport system permease subunit